MRVRKTNTSAGKRGEEAGTILPGSSDRFCGAGASSKRKGFVHLLGLVGVHVDTLLGGIFFRYGTTPARQSAARNLSTVRVIF